MNHYIITRYNYPFKIIRGIDLVGATDDGKKWLKNRENLFDKYYIPSIENQSCKNFELVFFCHKDSPKYLIDKLESYGTVVYDPIKVWFQKIETPVITTRLDSDDSLHKDFVFNIQENFKFVNYDKILDIMPVYYVVETGQAYTVPCGCPTRFISTISFSHERFSCSTEHPKMRKIFDRFKRLNFKGALHIIHGTNSSDGINKIRNGTKVTINMADYGLQQ